MQFLVLFLVIGCLSIANAMGDDKDNLIIMIRAYVDDNTLNAINSEDHKLTLLGIKTGTPRNSLVMCEGEFDGQQVVIKIFENQDQMDKEMRFYQALNATNNPSIEGNAIQNVYYAGQIFDRHPVMVMSYYDDWLEHRYHRQRGRPIRPFSTFYMFLQLVKSLKYLHSKGVLHAAISGKTIYLRGNKVFFGDFSCAAFFNEDAFPRGPRTAMYDLKLLVPTILRMAGIPWDNPAGTIFSQQTDNPQVASALERCHHFERFPRAQDACEFICIDQLLSNKSVPEYDKIIDHLNAAVAEIARWTRRTKFEWAMQDDHGDDLLGTISKYITLNAIDSNDQKLTLSYKYLGTTRNSEIICGGEFDGKEVAIKIFSGQDEMYRELIVYQALNAIYNPRIEDNGIPNVYYAGQIFNEHPVIVKSDYEESLATRLFRNQRHRRQDKIFFSRYSTFQVFLQSVKALKYLQNNGVLHNDIDPANIFLLGNKVMVGGFDCATLNGEQTEKGSDKFGSASYFRGHNRTAMDDLESLVYTIWHIAGVHPINQLSDEAAGEIFSGKNTHDEKYTFFWEKCKQFEDFPRARRACRVVCMDEILSGRPVPAYDTIIQYLEEAVNSIEKKTGQTEFEWLVSASSSSTRV